MIITGQIAQLLLRLGLGIGFILPVLDRVGFFGAPGEPNVAWGDWASFTAYTQQLMPYVNVKMASFFGLVATLMEIGCAVLLIIGYKIRYAAFASFGMTLIFALSMLFFLHYRAPFNYSVFVVAFSSLMLSTIPRFAWSLDSYRQRK
ncbi:DoxX family protein [Sphingobacterium kitahiroshimense]|uniref:DoxX family protein n=1 Tax=Sphingobacterium kitahiroshimense TaxID=470446 RepID=A0ABV0BXD7_9SPHI